MVESLSSDGLNLDRSSTEVHNVVALEVGQSIMLTDNSGDRSSASPEIVLWTAASGEQPGSFQTSTSWASSNGTTTSSPTTPSTPLNTPLSAAGASPQPPAQGSSRGAQAKVTAFNMPPTRTSSTAKSSSVHPSWSSPWRTDAKSSGSKTRGNQVCVRSRVDNYMHFKNNLAGNLGRGQTHSGYEGTVQLHKCHPQLEIIPKLDRK